MEIVASIVLQAVLLSVALSFTLLRSYVRLHIERRGLTPADYLTWGGWFATLGWVICSIIALQLGIDHPLTEDGVTDSVAYLKTVFIACYFFDVGLYLPKASIVVFYWWLIPRGFKRLRIGLWMSRLFALPFFVLNCIKLHRRQKVGLGIIFSLGAITMIMSIARFIAYFIDYDLDDPSGNAWCTAEMCTATIVVSLPGLKQLVVGSRSKSASTKSRYTNGYIQTGSGNPSSGSRGFASRSFGTGRKTDDEVELVSYSPQKSDPNGTRATANAQNVDFPIPLTGGPLGTIPVGGDGIFDCADPGHVALTYDDGPGEYTSDLLGLLARYDAKATFFITGNNNGTGEIDDSSLPWPSIIRRTHAEGHQIALAHLVSHADLTTLYLPRHSAATSCTRTRTKTRWRYATSWTTTT
ncbi:hypothetical protein F4778DRAFT_776944 [Xylariomycetidae sp. FL2044]|nr:hypothetical protein F4778DRAFT_776944 [Xylariomycetidae sp. FL2044]